MRYWIGCKTPINTSLVLGGIPSGGPSIPEVPGYEFVHESKVVGWPPKKDGLHIHGKLVEMTPQKAKELSEKAENTFVIILPDGIRYQLSEDHRFADSCDRLSRFVWIIPFKDTAEERAATSLGAPVPPCLKL